MFGFHNRAGSYALLFNENIDAWGCMFSYIEWIPKLFPHMSGYSLARDLAMKFYSCIKVFSTNFPETLQFYRICFSLFFPFEINRRLLMLNIKPTKKIISVTFWLYIWRKSKTPKMTQIQFITVSHIEFQFKSKAHFFFFCNNFSLINMLKSILFCCSIDEGLVLIAFELFFATFTAMILQLPFLLQRFYLQPQILKNCQNEIDKVVGHNRLPTLDDRHKWVFFGFSEFHIFLFLTNEFGHFCYFLHWKCIF